jgi:Tfp pilus assembly protein PilX
MLNQSRTSQQGAALVIGLIMLVLITLMLLTALRLGTTNFRSVSNMQYRNEAIAAAERAIQQVIDSDFTATTTTEQIGVDLDNDGIDDYLVNVAPPTCLRATQAFGADPSSLALPVTMTVASTWNTVWDIDATVNAAENVGAAAVRLRTGVRVLLSQAQRDARCP